MFSKIIPLVDHQDKVIGFADKLEAHRQGLLHSAFSVFVYRKRDNNIEILLGNSFGYFSSCL